MKNHILRFKQTLCVWHTYHLDVPMLCIVYLTTTTTTRGFLSGDGVGTRDTRHYYNSPQQVLGPGIHIVSV